MKYLQCPKCPGRWPTKIDDHHQLAWCIVLECATDCPARWFGCIACSRRKSHIVSTKGLARHRKKFHSGGNQDLVAPVTTPVTPPPFGDISNVTLPLSLEPLSARAAAGPRVDATAYSREQSQQYFDKEHLYENGMDYVMGLAFLDRKEILCSKLDNTEMEFAITLSDRFSIFGQGCPPRVQGARRKNGHASLS